MSKGRMTIFFGRSSSGLSEPAGGRGGPWPPPPPRLKQINKPYLNEGADYAYHILPPPGFSDLPTALFFKIFMDYVD